MKKLMLAIAASACAVSAYAAAPNPINLNVQIKGEVPSQDFFEVTVNSGDLDNVVFTHSEGWTKGNSSKVTLSWKVRSSYGPVRMLAGNLGEGVYIKNASDDAMQVGWNVSTLNNANMVGPYFQGLWREVVDAEVAKTGGLASLALWVIPKAPRPGTYSGMFPVVFETGFEG
ncbi:hypothetical protein LGM42_23785 [Burkholderia sp. AU39826]|uniref:hypothetical protein n=1 Tax=Burkholderia sp. AU39826 TaxID=2879634 RepID=UPI001CF45191|nr:hypothetical protein [Burkholderia sp. AU39826]MCA7972899.1 hypothetical protein [Burkholderia sp. AU39826]